MTYAERVENFKSEEYVTMTQQERATFATGECDVCRWNGADKFLTYQHSPGYDYICSECETDFYEMVKQPETDWSNAREYFSQSWDIIDVLEWQARENKDWPKNDGRI